MEFLRKSSVLILGFLLLVLLLSLSVNVRFLFQSRASGVGSITSFSVDNSYIFLSPLEARANAKERIRVTVFLLNNEGKGVLGKRVTISTSKDLTVEAVQENTDLYGRAVFDTLTAHTGEYFLEALVDGNKVTDGVRLKFN